MKLYKFRSFDNIEFTLDIILNNRLYCARHQDLNDPFEGLFSVLEWKGGITRGITRSIVRPITRSIIRGSEEKVYKTITDILNAGEQKRVCSLSRSIADVRMWSHYSASHTGIAIEIEIDESNEDCLYEVEYHPGIRQLTSDPAANPNRILSFKTDHWEYEQEHRIISEESFYTIDGKITGIYFGVNANSNHIKHIQEITSGRIPLFKTKINEDTASIVPGAKIE